jgi:hypothetical protein
MPISKITGSAQVRIAQLILANREDGETGFNYSQVKAEMDKAHIKTSRNTVYAIARILRENGWQNVGESNPPLGNKQITSNPVETIAEKTSKTELDTQSTSEAMFARLIPKIQTVILTPDIWIGFACALKRGFTGDLNRWLSLASRDFWIGRKINPYEEVSNLGINIFGNEKVTEKSGGDNGNSNESG